ncbi:MAG TPA: hypothetical protein VNI54_01620 [Thermoanaerobaculia bacterium]|nr:hypothetical protein [Thermoanaerobaculia bacterium]
MSDTFVDTFAIPGSRETLTYEREASGRLVRLSAGGRTYFAEDERGEKTFGEGLGFVREVPLKNGVARLVRAAGQSWIEEYAWDEIGRPVRIDGVEIARDEQRRVTACGEWQYAYAGEDLAVIRTPRGIRHVTRGADGRPVATRNGHGSSAIQYAADGARVDVTPLPPTWHRDHLGRLWTICDDAGRVETTFLWNGFSCIGRIDGDAGMPLSAFFSLDPSSTPVRVISAAGVTRIPRDAFGESLLAHERVPGLYGGAIHGGFVYFRSRALDPRCGSFDRRDPWHGRDDDPRRTNGFEGPLPVEDPPCGPYAVCQYDPVGRTDPTGEASGFQVGMGFLYGILDTTWSLQHNTAGLLGLDWTIAFWFSLIYGIGQAIGGSEKQNQLSRFFDYEGLYNERTGVWGIRRGIFGVKRAFTYQHIVVADEEKLAELNVVSAIVPNGKFEPTLYGTLLHVAPEQWPPLLLRGNGDPAIAGWTRSGGTAEAIAPGSPIPRFPEGGLHLDEPLNEVHVPLTCDVTELVPSGELLFGTVDEPRVATNIPFSEKLEAGQVVVLTDAAGAVDIKTVAEVDDKHATRNKGRRVRFTEPGIHVADKGVRLRILDKAEATDTGRKSIGGPRSIDIAEGTVKYRKKDLLRFKQGGEVVGAGVVEKFESQIVLDANADGLTSPLEIRVVVASGKATKGTLEGNKLKSTPPPKKGDPIVLASGDKKIAAIVKTELSADQVELDRTDAELAPLGANVTWKELKSGTKLGTADALPAGGMLTYTPEEIRQAPKTGMVVLRDASKPAQSVVRGVTSRNYDALVIAQLLPGETGQPYDIEVFPIKRRDIENLELKLDPRIKLTTPGAVNAMALQLVQLSTADVLAGPEGRPATYDGRAATLGGVKDLHPSRFVVLTGTGGGPQANVITRITANLELDREFPFTAGGPIDVISLRASGPVYDADAIDATHVVVHATAGGKSVQFPRFEAGAIVQAVFDGKTELYIAGTVVGTTLTLDEGPPGAAIAANAHGTIQLVVPFTPLPSNGTWRVGMNGKPRGLEANTISAEIWDGTHVAKGTDVALVQNGVTHVAKIHDDPIFVAGLLVASNVGAAGEVTIPTEKPSSTAVFTQKNEFLTLADVSGPALVQGPKRVVVIPYGPGAVAQKKMAMSSGTVRVPVDAEKFELERRKSVIFHELTHTKQSEFFGPLLFGFFPLFALEGILEGTTDVELPKFSKYVAATITLDGGTLFLTIPDTQGIELEEETKVQVEQGGAHLITLGPKNGDRFAIRGGGELVAGAVQVRRLTDEGGWGKFRDVVFNIMSGLTLGGVMNYVAGTVWGGFIYGIFKFIHFLGHRLGKAGDEFPATVVDSRTVRMTSEEGRLEIQGYNRVFLLKDGERSDLLDVERTDNDTIILVRATDFTGDIKVNPYASDDPLSNNVVDKLTYFNATVPDPAKPAQLLVQKNGKKELELHPFDIVSVNAGAIARRTNVTAVAAGGIVELEDAPPTFGPERAVRIAFVDENDPIGSVDSLLLTKMGMGWMRYLFDPWRQIHFGVDPKPDSAADWLARFARYSFSSHSWSAIIPGYGILDTAIKQPNKGHLARLEQQASDESGRVYSSQGKIRGGFKDAKGHAEKTAKVGDIARYWLTPKWTEVPQPLMEIGRLDEPGPGMNPSLIEVLPETGPESNAADVNLGALSTATRPGSFVPDAFYRKSAAGDPEAATGDTLKGMQPGIRGFVPPTPRLEISLGSYVAFTRPGRHRVTTNDEVLQANLAREAHLEKRQTIFFNVTVSDVTVTVGGTVITRNDALDEVKLLPGQRAVLKVDSEGEWVLTAERPGNVLRFAKDSKSATMIANTPGTTETLEVSRVYLLADGKYVDSVLATHGVHLPVSIHVPVRQFRVAVRESFELVSELKQGAPPVASAKAGQTVFAMLPVRIPPGASLTTAFKFADGVTAPNPSLIIEPVAVPKELQELIGEGRIYRIELPIDEPPEEPVTITFTINMGPDAGVPVSAKLDYLPHFVLTAPAFDVAVNANRDLASAEEIGKAFAFTGAPGVKAVVAANGKSVNVRVAARADGGTRRIMALSKTDPMKRALRTITVPAPPAAPVLEAEFDDISVFVEMGVSSRDAAAGTTYAEPAPTRDTSDITSKSAVVFIPPLVKLLVGESILDPTAFPGNPPAQRHTGAPALYDLRLQGRICYPIVPGSPGVVAGPTPVPVVVLLHGQHGAFTSFGGFVVTGSTTVAHPVTGVATTIDVVRATSVTESGNHLGYEYLQTELAEKGIASISVDTCIGNLRDTFLQNRADVLLATLDEWRKLADASGGKFSGRLDFNRVGLVGHSRGGDAVVRAAKDNLIRTVRNPASPQAKDRYGITAVCSLSPTDFTGTFSSNAAVLTPAEQLTYLVVYGSLDNDVAGRSDTPTGGAFDNFTGTGFRHYDRATCDKAMVFIRGACHNRFNTNWGIDKDLPADHSELLDRDPDLADAIVPDGVKHQEVSRFYIGGFFRWLLAGEAQLQDRFTGDEAPPAGITPSLQWSFGDELRRVDTFEQSPDNELGQERDTASYADVIRFGNLEVNSKAQGKHVPHQTRILDVNLLDSVSKPTALIEPLPVADWSVLRFLTFRIGRFFDLEKDPFVGGQPHLSVTLQDEAGKKATVAETEFFTATVPGKPFRKEFGSEKITFHRLETVRIPLSKFKGVDLHRVKRVSFDVDEKDKTHVFLDSVEVVRV